MRRSRSGPNSSGGSTFPVTTPVLVVDFSDGPTTTFGWSYWALALDGLSFDDSDLPIGGINPLPTGTTLTALLSPITATEFDSTVRTISRSFRAAILLSSGTTLLNNDSAVINLEEGAVVPEPGWRFLASGWLSNWHSQLENSALAFSDLPYVYGLN